MAEQRSNVEDELIKRAGAGDIGAFEQIFIKHKKKIFNYCLRMIGDTEAAKEATQDVFIKVFRRLSSLREERFFNVWLMRIASNLVKDVLNKKRHEFRLFQQEEKGSGFLNEISKNGSVEFISPGNSPEEEFLSNENRKLLASCLSEIKPLYREIIILHYIEGIKIEELSEITGLPNGTIKSRLSRGREQLADKLRLYHNKRRIK